MSRIEPVTDFEDTPEHTEAMEKWLETNFEQCQEGCDDWFDAPEDLKNGCCEACSNRLANEKHQTAAIADQQGANQR